MKKHTRENWEYDRKLGELAMKQHVGEYLQHLRNKGLAETTIYHTENRIKYFYAFLKKKKIRKISKETFHEYRKHLIDERKLHYWTLKGKILALRKYFQYLTQTKRYLFNPAEELTLPKRPLILPRDIPSSAEMQKILDSVDDSNRVGKRRKAILELLYSTGVRAKELLNLDIYDIDFKKRLLTVRQGKGRKDRVVPFGRKAADAVKSYIENVRQYHAKITGEKKLFLSMWGRKLKYKEFILVMGGARKGKRLRAHSVRHACAIGMLQNGADIRYIQEILGHKDITSTQIYTRIMPDYAKEVHEKYHPRIIKNYHF